MGREMEKIKFFVFGFNSYDIVSFEDSRYEMCDLYELRQDQGQLNFIEKIKEIKDILVNEIFARLTILENGSSVKVLIDPVFKGDTIFPLRLRVIRNCFKKEGFEEIKISFCDS